MEEDYVELIPEGLTRGVSLQEAYFLMLKEKEGERYLPVLLNKEEYDQLFSALNEKKYPNIRLMGRLALKFDIHLNSVHVFYPPHSNLSATLVFKKDSQKEKIACNIAEAIAVSLDMKCPILMQRTVFEDQMLRQKGEGQVSLPITAMNKKLLEEALQAAVEEENYELASVLRDELKHREYNEGADQF